MQNRIVWLDVVRFVAMFAVVMCHCCDPFTFTPSVTSPELKLCGTVYGSLLRPCVPLFVMITGALLLPVTGDAGPFYRKRISRVVWPFALWSVLYSMFPWLTGVLGMPKSVVSVCFPYATEPILEQSFTTSALNTARCLLNFGEIDAHMWYIYLLIGLYLYLPVFSAWVEKASERAKLIFLLVWAVTLFVPYYRAFVNIYLWGSCLWNEFYALYYFAGFNGYLLLGHYLRRHPMPLKRTLLLGALSFAAGYAVTFTGFLRTSLNPSSTSEQLELFYYFLSPNVVMMTWPIFALCQHVKVRSQRVQQWLASLTECGFGVYMIHFFLTGPSVWLMRTLGTPLYLQIPLAAAAAFALAWALTAALRRLLGKRAVYVVG